MFWMILLDLILVSMIIYELDKLDQDPVMNPDRQLRVITYALMIFMDTSLIINFI